MFRIWTGNLELFIWRNGWWRTALDIDIMLLLYSCTWWRTCCYFCCIILLSYFCHCAAWWETADLQFSLLSGRHLWQYQKRHWRRLVNSSWFILSRSLLPVLFSFSYSPWSFIRIRITESFLWCGILALCHSSITCDVELDTASFSVNFWSVSKYNRSQRTSPLVGRCNPDSWSAPFPSSQTWACCMELLWSHSKRASSHSATDRPDVCDVLYARNIYDRPTHLYVCGEFCCTCPSLYAHR